MEANDSWPWRQKEDSRISKNYDPISHRKRDLDFSREFHMTSPIGGRAINTGSLEGESESLWSFVRSASWTGGFQVGNPMPLELRVYGACFTLIIHKRSNVIPGVVRKFGEENARSGVVLVI
ncbi:hypothetical protein AVEN_76710-1 [Araneus ventricosus]|uniref:Uncharacterized protein n=1 Tax=Araneus ventricosus TaxID=182803 RepID=A0A4Y2BP34_ARAVE|nr:hypothetical protein AVEN_76710-1 [Araneus ventricosus]